MPDPAGKSPPGSGVDGENMKKCTRCLEDKPKSEFNKDAASKDGLTVYCRRCKSQTAKEWYETNKERHKKNAKARREKNPDRSKNYSAEWRKNNPDKLKEYAERDRPKKIERTYGITIEQYNNLLDQQNNCCAICGGVNENGYSLYVDHDHSCCKGKKSCGKCIRQLLCSSCNFMLGNAKDNPEILEAAKKYLERHSRSENLAKNLD